MQAYVHDDLQFHALQLLPACHLGLTLAKQIQGSNKYKLHTGPRRQPVRHVTSLIGQATAILEAIGTVDSTIT